MKKLIIGAIALLLFTVSALEKIEFYNTVEDIAHNSGYLYEEHFVTTEDGYIIRVQRIRKPGNEQKPPMYGSAPFSIDEKVYFINEPDAYGPLFVEAGYDVWITNMRGAIGSREHVSLSVYDIEFWDFDLADQTLDHVAAIQYIIDYYNSGDEDTLDGAESGEEKPNYGTQKMHAFGESQGAGSLAYAVALHPDILNSRISLMHYIFPSVTLAHVDSFLIFGSSLTHNFDDFLGQLGVSEAFTYGNSMLSAAGFLGDLSPKTCMRIGNVLTETGGKLDVPPEAFLDVLFTGFGPRSSKFWTHWYQSGTTLRNHGGSHLYDYGTERNLEVYGQEIPPHIPFENHRMPVALYTSNADAVSTPEDNLWLAEQLGDSLISFLEYDGKCHTDYPINVPGELIYDLLEIDQHYLLLEEKEEE